MTRTILPFLFVNEKRLPFGQALVNQLAAWSRSS